MTAFQYVLISSGCLSVLYLVYLLIFSNETNFKLLRLYLLVSIIIAMGMPFSKFIIHLDSPKHQPVIEDQVNIRYAEPKSIAAIPPAASHFSGMGNLFSLKLSTVKWSFIFCKSWMLISAVLLTRILLQILFLTVQYSKSNKLRVDKYVIVSQHRFRGNFSFFNRIFIYPDGSSKEDIDQIIAHEKIHAS